MGADSKHEITFLLYGLVFVQFGFNNLTIFRIFEH